MLREKLFRIFSLFLFTTALLNFLALKLYLYWTFHYFDSLVHFLAGVSVGFAGLWLLLRNKNTLTKKQIFWMSFFSALIIGILWEFYELIFKVTSFSDGINYVTDTSSDLLMDVLGGLLAGLYTSHLISKTNNG